jgi:hypothetical protein
MRNDVHASSSTATAADLVCFLPAAAVAGAAFAFLASWRALFLPCSTRSATAVVSVSYGRWDPAVA